MKTRIVVCTEIESKYHTADEYKIDFENHYNKEYKDLGYELNLGMEEIFKIVETPDNLKEGDRIGLKELGLFIISWKAYYPEDNSAEIYLENYNP